MHVGKLGFLFALKNLSSPYCVQDAILECVQVTEY